jgi:hypothetical protein
VLLIEQHNRNGGQHQGKHGQARPTLGSPAPRGRTAGMNSGIGAGRLSRAMALTHGG